MCVLSSISMMSVVNCITLALARCNFSIGFLLSFLSWTMFRTIASPLERQGCAVPPRGAPTILCRRFVRCDVTPSFRSMKGRFRHLSGIAERGGKCRSTSLWISKRLINLRYKSSKNRWFFFRNFSCFELIPNKYMIYSIT